MSTVKEIDTKLAEYYQNQGRDEYYNEDGIGKLEEFCEANGFEDDDLADEFEGENYQESTLIDMDDDFPLSKTNNNIPREQQIFKILKSCYNKQQLNNELPLIAADFFHITPEDVKKIRIVCSKQCSAMFNGGMCYDDALMKIMAIGYKNKYPYLQNLIDLYARDRATMKISSPKKPIMTFTTWSNNNKHLNELNNVDGLVTGAIKSFYARMCPEFQYNELIAVRDSLEMIAKYFIGAVVFVDKIANSLKEHDICCPFQMDVAVLFKESVLQNTMAVPDLSDDDDIDEIEEKEKEENDLSWNIGDIDKRLSDQKLKFIKHKFVARTLTSRGFEEGFRELQLKQKNKKKYPRNQRFIALIDRSNIAEEEENQHIDTMYMYEAPLNCRNIPNDFLHETFLNQSISCLLPNVDYTEDVKCAANNVYDDVIKQIKDKDEKLRNWMISNKNKIGNSSNSNLIYYFEKLRQKGYSDKKTLNDEELLNEIKLIKIKTQIDNSKQVNFKDYDINYDYKVVEHEKKLTENGVQFSMTMLIEENRYYSITVHRNDDPVEYKLMNANPLKCENVNHYKKELEQKNNTKEKPKVDTEEKENALNDNKENISPLSNCKGKLLTFSFHVIESDEIKCYMFHQGQMQRFYVEDLKTILPLLFDKTFGENREFPYSKEMSEILETGKNKLKDAKFEMFRKTYSKTSTI